MACRSSLEDDLLRLGFDICVPFDPSWYNAELDEEKVDLMRLPVENVESAFLIGNTKRLWKPFVDWCGQRKTELPAHPLDTYCQETITRVLERHHTNTSVYWSSTYSLDKLVSVQRVAVVAGFAYYDANTQMTIHPFYGTWTSYRAVAIVFGETPSIAPVRPNQIPKLMTLSEETNAVSAMKYALDLVARAQVPPSVVDEEQTCDAWIAVRDSVERGKAEYRFCTNQLRYHYSKNLKYLEAAMEQADSNPQVGG